MTLSIGITTRNRPESLRRCLTSVARFAPAAEVLVFDDGSAVPAEEQVHDAAPGLAVRFIRDTSAPGCIAGRNALVAAARHDPVLLLDDDTALLDERAIDRALGVLARDPAVGAVAFAQAEDDGRPWPERMQPGRGTAPVYVPSFIGFAHMLRRDLFQTLGGYRAEFIFYGEEKDYCLRMLRAGYRVVYLPDARVAHLADPAGRDPRRYVRQVIRNDCLGSLYNDPWPLALAGLPVRMQRFRRMAANIPGGDPGGLRWLLGELWRALPALGARRSSVGWTTIRRWRALAREPVPYV